MNKKIQSALISVFYKDGLENIILELQKQGVTIYSTGGTQQFIEKLGTTCVPVETVTGYPSILGGRVKTLHPNVFGGILGRRSDAQDIAEMQQYNIPPMDLVIVDLYPFEETLAQYKDAIAAGESEAPIIEKIDIGGPSMIRAAAKNFKDVAVVAAKNDYAYVENILKTQQGEITLEQRRILATKAFNVVMHYDVAIANYFNNEATQVLRYGENPHQAASFTGNLARLFTQLHGKELSYNNLVDVDAALQLLVDINDLKVDTAKSFFAIIKHTNVCGAALRNTVNEAWDAALAGDPESAFGGILISNSPINKATADAISEIFFEVLIAPSFDADALSILQAKKNRILLQLKTLPAYKKQDKSLLNGTLTQNVDEGNITSYDEKGGKESSTTQKEQLLFANILCKHLKSNAIALVNNYQLIGKGCGQTSRIDSLRQAIDKAKHFKQPLQHSVLASDAFFPFDDCVKMAHAEGIEAFIQPGGSIRDADSIQYCKEQQLVMVLTGMRHFKH
jgi:phosphoribosylaminoimidazolecarboxamide formyltransferase / IMP cyclohydrolase